MIQFERTKDSRTARIAEKTAKFTLEIAHFRVPSFEQDAPRRKRNVK
jgi:hypothetical protein